MSSRTRLAVALAGLALLCTACQDSDPVDPLSPTPQSSAATATSSPTPTASPTQETAKQAAIRQARPLVDQYFQVTGASKQDPANFDVDEFKKVAISAGLVDAQNNLAAVKAKDYRQVGETELVQVTVADVDLANHPKRTPPEIPTVQFRVCYDVSNLDLLDQKGNSVVPDSRKPTGVVTVGVSNYKYPSGPWLVSYLNWAPGDPC